ncbi:Matrix metalloproteinase-17-like, partial [Scleropages formosus]
ESHLLGRDTVRALMYYALKVWSDIAPLDFHEVAGNQADIQVDFTKADHNDGYPFDGPGGTVAHAFYPGDRLTAGDSHFDDDEAWTFRSPDAHGMDLFAVAVHEFGHAIGLAHTSAVESIMRPYYQGPVGDPLKYHLPYEDKVRVWQLYGTSACSRRSGSTDTRALERTFEMLPAALRGGFETLCPTRHNPTPPAVRTPLYCWICRRTAPLSCRNATPPTDLPRCPRFSHRVPSVRPSGKYFWRLTREKQLVSLRPVPIHRFWRGLPTFLDSVDAVYERPGDHRIVFFKGLKYWVFKDNNVEEGYPRPISDFGLPTDGVDAAFVWPHNEKTYFFKDGRYWRYDDYVHRMDLGYPKDSTLWKGVPPQLDDAMRWSDGASYFFKGAEYWRVAGSGMEVEDGYPRPIGKDWLVCADMLSDSPAPETNGTETHPRGRHRASHAGSNYEVCSCTSDSATALRPRLFEAPLLPVAQLSSLGLLVPLWTIAAAIRWPV